jgi:LysM repeat protein
MKRLALAYFSVLWTVGATAQDKESYILQYRDIAISEMHRTGIPASIKLAQAVLESSYGNSELARKAHNHFGIKCGRSWAGQGYHLKDDDRDPHGQLVNSCFRVFGSAEESFIAHSDFLADPAKSTRYGALFSLNPNDYKGWAEGLQRSGYATNPSYARLLIKIIEEQHLEDYDVRRTNEDLATQYVPYNAPSGSGLQGDRISYTIRFQNDIPYILANAGDNVQMVSKRLDIPARRLVRYNEIIDGKRERLEDGERLYLQEPKRKYHGNQKSHVVDPGETVLSIAHDYGIKSKILRKRNNLPEDCEPTPGSRIALRGKQKNKIPCASENSIIAQAPAKSSPPPSPVHAPAARIVTSEPTTETIRAEAASAPTLSDIFVSQTLSYTVQPKDTLYGIVSQYGISVSELKKINNLNSDVIQPGQSLKVKKQAK